MPQPDDVYETQLTVKLTYKEWWELKSLLNSRGIKMYYFASECIKSGIKKLKNDE